MQAVRVARMVDKCTGDIVLRGVGMERLSQALEAGLVADAIRSDVESVRAENGSLKAELGAARKDAQMEAQKASRLRREKLDGYLHEDAVRESRHTLREIAFGFAGLGVAVGMSVATIVITIVI